MEDAASSNERTQRGRVLRKILFYFFHQGLSVKRLQEMSDPFPVLRRPDPLDIGIPADEYDRYLSESGVGLHLIEDLIAIRIGYLDIQKHKVRLHFFDHIKGLFSIQRD